MYGLMSSFEQKFDPSDPKYKTTADLPIEHQDNFYDSSRLLVDQSAKPGFIRKQAADRFVNKHSYDVERAEQEARREDFLRAVAKLLEGKQDVYAGELAQDRTYPITEFFVSDDNARLISGQRIVAPIGERFSQYK